MQSENNQFISVGDPIKRYVKTVDYQITGWRLDPDTGKQVPFILATPTEEFDYDTAVLEFYSEKDHKFFLQKNKYLFERGLIKEFAGTPAEVDLTNTLSDDEILELATTRLPNQLKSKLDTITSDVTMKRVLAQAKEIGRPIKVLEIIEARLKELSVQ